MASKRPPKPGVKARKKAQERLEAELHAACLAGQRERLLSFSRFAQGDPHLTAWEEGFAISMGRWAYGSTLITPNQDAIIRRISEKLGYDTGEAVRPVPDSQDVYEQHFDELRDLDADLTLFDVPDPTLEEAEEDDDRHVMVPIDVLSDALV